MMCTMIIRDHDNNLNPAHYRAGNVSITKAHFTKQTKVIQENSQWKYHVPYHKLGWAITMDFP